MATSNTALRVADLDFFSIRNNLKDYLRSQSEFTDYDFEGSGMSVLLDVLSYNTYYNSFYLNMAANESFLDTAQLRQNILSHAKVINYVPSSSQGATAIVNVRVTPQDAEPSPNYISLDKYTTLLGQDKDGINYPFVTINANTAYISNSSYLFSNVIIKQGEVVTRQFIMTSNNTSRRFSIPSQNVDTTTMVVTIQESSSNTYTREFKAAQDITTINGESLVYYVEEDEHLEYSIYFGDGILGYKPKNGNIISVTYLDNVGARSNNIGQFAFTQKVDGVYNNNVRVSVVSGTYGGVDKETPEQIRFRAPYFYSTQNRAVTVNDYEALITKDYQNIDAVSIWGGEDNDPVVYGKVYLSLKTKGYYSLTNLEKELIKKNLIESRNVLTVIPEIVDPNYIFLQVRGKVTYNSALTSKTVGQLQQIIKDAINNYNTNELNTFKSTFRKSRLQYYIENSDPSITGSDINIYLQSRNLITLNQTKNYEIKYNTSLQKGTFLEKLFTYPQITVLDSSATSRNVFFEEVPESYTGVDSIDLVNAGINYNNPTITITGDGIGATATSQVVNGKIRTITVTNKGSGYTRAYVNIVDDRNGSEGIAIARLEAKFGILRTFYYKDNGEKVIVDSAAGTINYDTGVILLSSVRPSAVITNNFYDSNILTVSVVPESEIIPPLRNRILTIEEGNSQSIQIELVADTQ
jgi:hypothetical protein